MIGIERVAEILVETGAFKDLEKPVILTSGELGIYYINTEKVLQDKGEWEQHGDDSKAMIVHALGVAESNNMFNEIIGILAGQVRNIFRNYDRDCCAISGGQRRDWLFSGPVAARLGIPHISLYKQEDGRPDRIEFRHKGLEKKIDSFEGLQVVHIVDLITEGSSVYRQEGGKEKGWVPMLRDKGADIDLVVTVVDRMQNGLGNLYDRGVALRSFVDINEDFLNKYATHPGRDVQYFRNPEAWSEEYLRKNGVLDLVAAFDPKGTSLPRARRFIERYELTLQESGKFNQLENEVLNLYGTDLKSLFRL